MKRLVLLKKRFILQALFFEGQRYKKRGCLNLGLLDFPDFRPGYIRPGYFGMLLAAIILCRNGGDQRGAYYFCKNPQQALIKNT